MSDEMTVLGVDGIRRSFDEHYDTLKEVEQDPTGAMWAIHKQADRIEELEAELEGHKKLMLTLAGDKIDLVSELAGVKFKLAKAIDFVAEVGGGFKFGESLVDWANLHVLKARTLLAELSKERSDEKGETDE